MPSCYLPVTSSPFRPRSPAGKHDLVFRVALGGDTAVARYFGVSRMTAWRWRRGKTPLPARVTAALPVLLQNKVTEAHQAEQEFKSFFWQQPPSSPRPLTGCCAGYARRPKKRSCS